MKVKLVQRVTNRLGPPVRVDDGYGRCTQGAREGSRARRRPHGKVPVRQAEDLRGSDVAVSNRRRELGRDSLGDGVEGLLREGQQGFASLRIRVTPTYLEQGKIRPMPRHKEHGRVGAVASEVEGLEALDPVPLLERPAMDACRSQLRRLRILGEAHLRFGSTRSAGSRQCPGARVGPG